MAVGPGRVFSGRGARGVEETGLREQDERPLGVLAAPDRRLRGRELKERPAQVDGAGPGAFLRFPGDRAAQGPVQLEGAGAVAEVLEPPHVARRETMTGDPDDLAWR